MLYSASSTHHRCRHRHCKQWLKPPATDPRDAFCCARCCEAFYRLHCRVCERPIVGRNSRRQVCDRPKCQGQFQRHRGLFFGTLYPDGPVSAKLEKSSANSTAKSTIKSDLPSALAWRRIAGPELPKINLCIPLDGAFAARIARINNAHWNRTALIGPTVAPVNILGGYRFPGAPEIWLPTPISATPISATPTSAIIAADLSIPGFLRRTVGNA
jgi:hypothetical protein